jgi:hypothetical protein
VTPSYAKLHDDTSNNGVAAADDGALPSTCSARLPCMHVVRVRRPLPDWSSPGRLSCVSHLIALSYHSFHFISLPPPPTVLGHGGTRGRQSGWRSSGHNKSSGSFFLLSLFLSSPPSLSSRVVTSGDLSVWLQ